MKAKEFNKLKQADITKMKARYEAKKLEFEALSLDELKEMFATSKMSSTDRHALMMVTNEKLQAQEPIKVIEDLDGE